MMSQPLLARETHDKICPCRSFTGHVCDLCGNLVELPANIEIGVEDKIPLKGQ